MTPWDASKHACLSALALTAALLVSRAAHAQDSGPIEPARLSQIVKAWSGQERACIQGGPI
jgi:hypothetical protein